MCSKTQMGAEMTSKIIGTGSYLPSHVVTNDDLAKVVDTDDEWISSRTGIKERRIVDNEKEETALKEKCKSLNLDNEIKEKIDTYVKMINRHQVCK